MSGFAVGDKVEVSVKYDCLYNGVTGEVLDVDERCGPPVYEVLLDVGGRIAAEEACLVEPGTRNVGTYTYRIEYR